MIIGSKELIRDINSNLVLETIIHRNSISRAALSKELGLTKATISTIVQDLIDRHLVIEIGSDNTELGRKPILLTYNNHAGYALCIDIQADRCRALLSDLEAQAIKSETFDCPKHPVDLPEILIHYIKGLLSRLPKTTYGLVGITLSIHGVTYEKSIKFVPYYDLSNLPLAESLEKAFQIPIYVENEANLSAIGEHTFVYDNADLASISIHSGIGLGLIMNNGLVKGYKGYSGEVGHTIIDIDGRPCPCGNRGCLEQYVSQTVLLREFSIRKQHPNTTLEEFLDHYQKGDKDAKAIMELFVKYLSVGLNNILNSYNPEIVVINSAFTSRFPSLTDEVIASLQSKMNNYACIKASTLKGQSSLLGGLCVSIRNFLGIRHLRLHNTDNSPSHLT